MSIGAFYTVGRVNMVQGSVVVTGLGTAWAAAGIRAGDDFRINGAVVRIEKVNSNNQLELAFPWGAANLNNAQYEIKYTPDSERILATSREIIQGINTTGLNALKTVTPAPNTLPYFTGLDSGDVTALTPFARQLLAGSDEGSLRTLLGLVTQNNASDSTLNRVLRVGAFGLGSLEAPLLDNINRFDIPAGFYRIDARIVSGTLPPAANIADSLIILRPTPSQTIQVYLGMTELGRNFIRKSNSDGSWAPWRSIMMDFEFGSGPGSGLDADTLDGFDSSDFLKVTDYTSEGMLALIKAVDGTGSGLDADLLQGQEASFYRNASNINAGTLADARLPTTAVRTSRTLTGGDGIQTIGNLSANRTIAVDSTVVRTSGNQTIAGDKLFTGVLSSFADSNTPTPNVRFGRDTAQYITLHGGSAANFLGSVSSSTNNKAFRIGVSIDAGSTYGAIYTFNHNGTLTASAFSGDGSGISNVNAITLGGADAAFFRNASNLNAGTVADARLPTTAVRTARNLTGGDGINAIGNLSADRTISVDSSVARRNSGNTFTGEQIFAGVSRVRSSVQTGNAELWLQGTDGSNRAVLFAGNNSNITTLRSYSADSLTNFNFQFNSSGRFTAGSFEGDGANINNINASNIASGTLADARIPNTVVRTSRSIFAGNGLSGGGDLSGNISLTLGTPSTVTHATSNSLSAGSHTHNFDISGAPLKTDVSSDAGPRLYYVNSVTGDHVLHRIGENALRQAFNLADRRLILTAGNGLTGGGDLTANRTVTLGTPSSITVSSTNSVSGTSHTHFLDLGSAPIRNQAAVVSDATSLLLYINGTDNNTISRIDSFTLRSGFFLADSRLTLTAGNGLTGGGDLSANRTLTLGTPSSITATSTNSVTGTSHTHEISSATIRELIATMGVNLVGTFVFARKLNSGSIVLDQTISGSNLAPASTGTTGLQSALSGTWRCLGNASQNDATLFLRIS